MDAANPKSAGMGNTDVEISAGIAMGQTGREVDTNGKILNSHEDRQSPALLGI